LDYGIGDTYVSSVLEEVSFALIEYEDAVLDCPQSGERTRGRRNIQGQRASQPGRKRFTVRRIIGRGDLWVAKLVITYDRKPSYTVSVMEFRDDKVARGKQYFADHAAIQRVDRKRTLQLHRRRFDGGDPLARLIFDGSGNLYSTTWAGGSSNCGLGCGVVFELTLGSSGWTESVLYSFTNRSDGANSDAALIFDKAGNLYGVTWYAGAYGWGVVFKLATNSDGSWTESVLHQFKGDKDGPIPGPARALTLP
jgi:hypothetical protein